MSLVLDTGVTVALLNTRDPDHGASVDLVRGARERLTVPAATLVEVDYWIRKKLGSGTLTAFFEDLAGGAYELAQLDAAGYRRAAQLEVQYADLGLGLVDAAVIATCEHLGETKVATLDRRHFSVVRPAHCERLTILPG